MNNAGGAGFSGHGLHAATPISSSRAKAEQVFGNFTLVMLHVKYLAIARILTDQVAGGAGEIAQTGSA